MHLSDEQLIAEAIEINHAHVGKENTREKYKGHLVHFSRYLASVHAATLSEARRKHVLLFMAHLEKQGGKKPHESRRRCEWCRVRGYPDGRGGCGWSASTRKGYLSAVKFLYLHFQAEEDLPDLNPTALVPSPKVVHTMGFTPTMEEIKKLLATEGSPKARLIATWTFYAPSRCKTFADALWKDVDLERGTWAVVGKGDKVDVFDLAPPLLRELRLYRRWQLSYAEERPAMLSALSDPKKAYVLVTRNGRRMAPMEIYKSLRRHAVRAGVGLREAPSHWDSSGGMTSMVTPHAMRRAWATIALNDKKLPIDVVSAVLNHSDISTTRRHYAPTKSERAREALVSMSVG
jgi:integrase